MRAFWAASILLVIGLGGCDQCYNVACDEPDVAYLNGLQFSFDSVSFPLSQVDNAIVLRFAPGSLQPVDTIFLKDMMTAENRAFTIPLTVTDNNGAVESDYGIYDNSHEYAYFVTTIVTKGHYPTDCCCCYRNTQKTFRLNGVAHDRTGVTDPVVLTK